MIKFLQVVHALVLICLCTVCISGSVLLLHLNKTLTKVDAVVVDADSVTKRADLLEKQTSFLILKSGLVVDQVSKQSAHEAATLDALDAGVNKSFTDLDKFILASTQNEGELVQTATSVTQQVSPVLIEAHNTMQQATGEVAALHAATVSLNAVLTDPSIPASLKASQQAAEATASTMQHVDGTTADVQQAVHGYLHPRWYTQAVNWTLNLGKLFVP